MMLAFGIHSQVSVDDPVTKDSWFAASKSRPELAAKFSCFLLVLFPLAADPVATIATVRERADGCSIPHHATLDAAPDRSGVPWSVSSEARQELSLASG